MESQNDEIQRLVQRMMMASGATRSPVGGSDLFTQQLMQTNAPGDRAAPREYAAVLPPPDITRFHYIAAFAKEKKPVPAGMKTVQIRQSVAPAIEHGAAPEIASLRPINLREVARRVNVIHHDRVLYATVAHEPFRQTGTCVLLEDTKGDVAHCGLYNYVMPSEDPADVLPRGCFVALLSPYMRNAGDDRTQGLMLRCDNPQCVVTFDSEAAWLAAREGREPPVEILDSSYLRKEGNNEFKRGKLKQAIQLYTRALKHPLVGPNDKVACLSNRAEAYLRQKQWEYAASDCEEVMRIEKSHTKATFRLAKALLHLGQAAKAKTLVKSLLDQFPSDRAFKEAFSEAERVHQEELGHYNLEAMRREASSSSPMKFHASYVSDAVQIGVEIPMNGIGSYRGCAAKKQLAEGDIVCASKAFVFVPDRGEEDMSLRLNLYSKQMESGKDTAMISEMIYLLNHRPMLGRELYKLSSGEGITEENELEKIQVRRIRGIKTSNAFGQTQESLGVAVDWQKFKEEQQLGRQPSEEEAKAILVKHGHDHGGGSGLWIQESQFNHSCIPNSTWSQIGDHMFIRTTRQVQRGEELCISYTAAELSYSKRCEIFQNWVRPGVGFQCACDLCHLLRTNSALLQMEQEVESAYSEAARLVTMQQMPMAVAAEQVMPEVRRKAIISKFCDQPLRLQHRTIQKLEVMQGAVLNFKGDFEQAYECYKRAAAIGYAVSGGSYDHSKNLWRLVGSGMRCGKRAEALGYLTKIRSMLCFMSMGPDANEAFRDLTMKYASPWWADEYDPHVKHLLNCMIVDVNKSVNAAPKNQNSTNVMAKAKKNTKKKKKNRRK